jgi:uncharacterized protein (DUF433 family)
MTLTYKHLWTGPNGDTAIDGTGLRVYTLATAYAMGESAEYIAAERDLPLAAVFEALAYAEEHPEEMVAIREADEAARRWHLSTLRDDLREMAEETHRRDQCEIDEAIRQAKEARLGSRVPR